MRATHRPEDAPSLPGPVLPLTRYFHPVLAARRLRDRPVRVTLGGVHHVLFRDRAGRPAALLDRCPHRFAPLSAGRVRDDGRLACPYHGWHFDASGSGRSPSQPGLARCDTIAFQIVERHGWLWLADHGTDPATIPGFGERNDGYVLAGAFTTLFAAPLHVCLANFTEDEHVPWVHTRLGWDEAGVTAIDFACERFGDRTEVRWEGPQRPSKLTPLLFVLPGDRFVNRWVTRFDPLRTEYTISWRGRDGSPRPFATRATIYKMPVTERETRFVVFTEVAVHDARLRPLLPIVKRAATALGWLEVRDDQRFVPLVADTPFSTQGMRLGRFDEPVVHNLRLLRALYYGEPGSRAGQAEAEQAQDARPHT